MKSIFCHTRLGTLWEYADEGSPVYPFLPFPIMARDSNMSSFPPFWGLSRNLVSFSLPERS